MSRLYFLLLGTAVLSEDAYLERTKIMIPMTLIISMPLFEVHILNVFILLRINYYPLYKFYQIVNGNKIHFLYVFYAQVVLYCSCKDDLSDKDSTWSIESYIGLSKKYTEQSNILLQILKFVFESQ